MILHQIGRYDILEELGRGGMGTVYRAHDPDLNRQVIIKLIALQDSSHRNEWKQRFQREVQAVAQFNHPNIVTIHDVDLKHEPPYVVMELLTGGTLRDRLKQKRLSWREALVLLHPLAQALSYAHQAGVIHRDVTPTNVMFAGDKDDTLKLVDFGLARWQAETQITQTGTVIGTPAYMSPEQARDEIVDIRTDIFSLGIIFFEAIAGFNPLDTGNFSSTMLTIIKEEEIDTSPLVDNNPPAVISLIKRAITKNPEERYSTCKALISDLTVCLENHSDRLVGNSSATLDSNLFNSAPSRELTNRIISSSDMPAVKNLELPGGTMPPDSKFYVARAADHECWQHMNQAQKATTLFVQAPRQMGKSSLMLRMLHRAKTELNKLYALIDFQEFPQEYFVDTNEENFLIEFCLMIGEELGITEAIDKYWTGRRTNIVKCSRYMGEYVIPQIDEPLILALDEVNRLLPSPFRSNFFGMLRAWHNKRGRDENFAKMTLFLSSSSESSLLIEDEHQSPFNVAEPIALQDFIRAEVEELNRYHYSPLSDDEIDHLMDLTGGHPYLIRVALYQVASGAIDFDTLHTQATEDNGPFGHYLQRYLLKVLKQPELKSALTQICRTNSFHTNSYEETKIFHRLKEDGLIKKVGEQVVMHNKLYSRYFEERLHG